MNFDALDARLNEVCTDMSIAYSVDPEDWSSHEADGFKTMLVGKLHERGLCVASRQDVPVTVEYEGHWRVVALLNAILKCGVGDHGFTVEELLEQASDREYQNQRVWDLLQEFQSRA